jgi:hypothetical protein
MKTQIFKLPSRADDAEGISSLLQEADIIFARDENGTPTEGCGWNQLFRIDEDYIAVGVTTLDEIMDLLMLDPRLKVVRILDGWEPGTEPEIFPEIEISETER